MEEKEFNEKIKKEYDEYLKSVMQLSKEELIKNSFEITFKRTLKDYLLLNRVFSEEDMYLFQDENVLEFFYDYYKVDSDCGPFIDTFDEIIESVLGFDDDELGDDE